MVFDSALPGTLEEKLCVVWGQMCIAYDAVGTAAGERLLHALFVGMFATSRTALPRVYSQLHSKAAVGRHCVPAVDNIMRLLAEWTPGGGSFVRDEGGGMTDMVRELLSNLARFYECIAFHPSGFRQRRREAHDALLATGIYDQSLCSFFMHRKRKLFHLTEKAHFCQHISINLLSSSYNPRFGWTYQDKYTLRVDQFRFWPGKKQSVQMWPTTLCGQLVGIPGRRLHGEGGAGSKGMLQGSRTDQDR